MIEKSSRSVVFCISSWHDGSDRTIGKYWGLVVSPIICIYRSKAMLHSLPPLNPPSTNLPAGQRIARNCACRDLNPRARARQVSAKHLHRSTDLFAENWKSYVIKKSLKTTLRHLRKVLVRNGREKYGRLRTYMHKWKENYISSIYIYILYIHIYLSHPSCRSLCPTSQRKKIMTSNWYFY